MEDNKEKEANQGDSNDKTPVGKKLVEGVSEIKNDHAFDDNEQKINDVAVELVQSLWNLYSNLIDSTKIKSKNNSKNIDTIREDFKKLINRLTKTTQNFDIPLFIDELNKYLNTSKRLLYSEFTSIIIDLNNSDEQRVGIIISNLESCISYSMNEKNEVSEDIQKTLLKLWDHANLASNQYNYFTMTDDIFIQKVKPLIDPKIDDLKEQYSSLSDEVNKAEDEISKNVEEMKNTKFKIISDIIGLISIFVAISFVMFGGMTLLNSLFDFSDMQYVPITEMLCLGSLIGLILIAIIYAFMVFILKLLDKPYEDKPILNKLLKNLVILLTVICAVTFLIWFNKPNVNIYNDKNVNMQNRTTINQDENTLDNQNADKKSINK